MWHDAPVRQFGETVLSFSDPDGMSLALVGTVGAETESAWAGGDIPAEHAIRGFHGVTLLLGASGATGAILTDVLGFTEAGREDATVRFKAATPRAASSTSARPKASCPALGRGSVHHVAFRAADDAEQAEMARKLVQNTVCIPPSRSDRQYFRSIYFREPGGILFEIATDEPGFAVDGASEAGQRTQAARVSSRAARIWRPSFRP